MTKNQHRSFVAWLRNQRRRDDPVGDLARDAAADRHWPKAAKSLPRLLDYLAGRGACPGAVEACRRAWAEFRAGAPTFAHGLRGQGASKGTSSGAAVGNVGERGASWAATGGLGVRYYLSVALRQGRWNSRGIMQSLLRREIFLKEARVHENHEMKVRLADMTVKRCTRCGRVEPLERFALNKHCHDGRSSWCRECHRTAVREWRRTQREGGVTCTRTVRRRSRPQSWRAAAADMVMRLRVDLRNAQMLARPWSRAAHSMVQGWRIRLSRPPAKGNARVTARPTWTVFARLAVGILATKANHAKRSDWHLWATRRVTAGSRYIRKSKRSW